MIKQIWWFLIILIIGGAAMGLSRLLPQRKMTDLEYIYIEDAESLPSYAADDEGLLRDLEDGPVLIISRGEKSTGGYHIELIASELEDDHLEIEVTTSDPKPGSFSIMVITHPYVHVKTEGAMTYSVTVNGSVAVERQSLL